MTAKKAGLVKFLLASYYPYDMHGKKTPTDEDVKLRVRYAETDQMGHAYYANYLVWFEVGRTSYCRAQGLDYSLLEERDHIFLPVIQASCRYLKPLHYDREFVVKTRVAELRSRALTFQYEVRSVDGRTLFADGTTKHIFTDGQGKPRSLPQGYRRLLSGERPEASR